MKKSQIPSIAKAVRKALEKYDEGVDLHVRKDGNYKVAEINEEPKGYDWSNSITIQFNRKDSTLDEIERLLFKVFFEPLT